MADIMKFCLATYIFLVFGLGTELAMAKSSTSFKKCADLKTEAEAKVLKVFFDFSPTEKLTHKIKDDLVKQTPSLYKEYSELKACFNDLFFAAHSESEIELISKGRQWAFDFGSLVIFLEALDGEQRKVYRAEEQHIKVLLKKLVPESSSTW